MLEIDAAVTRVLRFSFVYTQVDLNLNCDPYCVAALVL